MKSGHNILGLVVTATLVVQIGVFNTTVSEKTASLEKSRQTIESQGETIKGVAEQYESLLGLTQSVLVPYCNGGGELLSEARLGLDPFTRTKTLTIDMMQHIGLDLVEQFAGVLPSNSAGIVLASEGALEIHVQDREISFHNLDEEQVWKLRFELFLRQGGDASLCRVALNLHFSDPAELPAGWEVTNVFGRAGMAHGEFSLPYGTEFVGGSLWTSDCTNNNVSILDLAGNMNGVVEGLPDDPLFNTPADIKIRNNKLYVVSENSHLLQVFDIDSPNVVNENAVITTRVFDSDNGSVEMIYPLGIAIGGGRIAITDGKSRVIGLDEDLKVQWVSDNSGAHNPYVWSNPYYIEYHPQMEMFVASNQSQSEMAIVDLDGKKVRAFGQGVVSSPFELGISPNGNIFVSDAYENKAFIFDYQSDFSSFEEFVFPDSFGVPKTMTSISDSEFVVGFVGNGTAYFAVFKNSLHDQLRTFDASPSVADGALGDRLGSQSEVPANHFNVHKAGYATYVKNCMSCHETGMFGAPRRGNPESWDKFPRNINSLLAALKQGDGVATRNGGCVTCSDAELLQAIKFMLPAKWERTGY